MLNQPNDLCNHLWLRSFLPRPRKHWARLGAGGGLILSCLLFSCSGGANDDDKSSVDSTDGADTSINPDRLTGDGDGETEGKTTSQQSGLDDKGMCQELGVQDGCAGEVYEGEGLPLDLYLMFDQSGSMLTKVDSATNATRMDVVRSAVKAFLEDEESAGLGVGIGYFGHQPIRKTSCDPADYTMPDVEIGALPGLTDELLASLDAREPTGETPTGAAIRGACDYVARYKDEHAGRNPAILFVTDGEPKAPLSADCSPTLDDAVAAAEQCFQEQGVRIYVLGVGPSLTNLRVIAEAGGTEKAFLADQDNAEQVLEAFVAVRYAAQLPCELRVDSDALAESDINLNDSTVGFLDIGCGYHNIDVVDGPDGCGKDGGWYFDDPSEPDKIHLCEATCGDVKSTGRQLYYSIGCSLDVLIR